VIDRWSEANVLSLFERCSNAGRWGQNDALGTLNLITPERRRQALAAAWRGEVVPLGRPITSSVAGVPVSLQLTTEVVDGDVVSAGESLTLTPHGFEVTHLDALGHSFHAGRAYNGRSVGSIVGDDGLRDASVFEAHDGIVTRGVLLDVAKARGLSHLEAGDGIDADDLDAAEALTETTVQPGDAVVIRSGLQQRLAGGGRDTPELREGLLPETIPWLHGRDVAVYAGDCIERLPSGYAGIPLPLHQIGMVSMGLWFLDNPDVEALRDACQRFDSSVFALIIAPLAVMGGTASVVNPLALF